MADGKIEPKNEVEKAFIDKCRKLAETLIDKNRAYGNSALSPVRIFSKASNTEQIRVRMDDKISRLARGKNTGRVPEDTLLDFAGYAVLLMVAQDMETEGKSATPPASKP